MTDDHKQKISEAIKRCLQSPTYCRNRSEGLRQSWTPARRAALSRERREFWRKWREAKAAERCGSGSEAGGPRVRRGEHCDVVRQNNAPGQSDEL
jgi:hypothetical protein